jgi:sugar diacid utilization regulator
MISSREERGVIYIQKGDISGEPTLAVNMFDGDMYLGSISVTASFKPLGAHDKQILVHLSDYIAKALLRPLSWKQNHNIRLATLLSDMLNDVFVSEKTLSLLTSLAGFLLSDVYIAMTVWHDDMNTTFSQYIIRRMTDLIPGLIVFSHQETIVAVCNQSYSERKMLDYSKELHDLFVSLRVRAGVSDKFTGLLQLRSYHRQSAIAMRYSIDNETDSPFSTFSIWRNKYPLDMCCGALEPEMLYSPGLRRLLDYDKDSSVSYLETLKVYLEENLNAAAAARRLFIQRNTLLCRLERLTNILDEDISDPDIRLHLSICLKLHERQSNSHRRKTKGDGSSVPLLFS